MVETDCARREALAVSDGIPTQLEPTAAPSGSAKTAIGVEIQPRQDTVSLRRPTTFDMHYGLVVEGLAVTTQ